jgi:hypothetical protein
MASVRFIWMVTSKWKRFGHAVTQQGYRVLYREAHILLEELADATLDGNRKQHMELLATVPLLIIDDLGMRKLPLTTAEEMLEIIMRRYERASTLITSNRLVEDWGKLLDDSAAVFAMLDRLLHHGHVLKCGPRSWRTKTGRPTRTKPTTTATAKDKDAGQRTPERPAASRLRIQRPPTPEPHPQGILVETRNPPTASPSGQLQRVSTTDSFGANSLSSALDHSARRDPGRVNP